MLVFSLLLGCLTMAKANGVSAAQKVPKLNVKKIYMTIGGDFQLRLYNMAKTYEAVYVSSNPSVVSVKSVATNDKKAVLKAVSVGSCNIKVTITGWKKKPQTLKCRVKVSPEAVSIKFTPKKLNLRVGQDYISDVVIKPFSCKEQPVYESSNPAVAKVNPLGIVTAVSPGTATITATLLDSNLSAVCTVNVRPPFPQDE